MREVLVGPSQLAFGERALRVVERVQRRVVRHRLGLVVQVALGDGVHEVRRELCRVGAVGDVDQRRTRDGRHLEAGRQFLRPPILGRLA